MKKSIFMFVVSLFVFAFSGSAFASEKYDEVITEKLIKVISIDKANARTKITSLVEMEKKTLMKIESIRILDNGKSESHAVRYVDCETGRIVKAFSWTEKDGKVSFRKGQKSVKIVTEK